MKAAELFDLTGQIALVTGASSGLGARFARTLAANGAKVVCAARRKDRLETLVATIEKAGGTAVAVEADVTVRASMRQAFAAAHDAFGAVNLLVNNAGVGSAGRAIEQEQIWDDVLAVNLDAVYRNAQLAAQTMVEAGKPGAIVNIASVLGFGVAKGLSAYAVSKAGVVQLTKALALEWASRGIRVNAIAPGYFVTEINEGHLKSPAGEAIKKDIPQGRFGAQGDLDGALLLLAAPKAGAFITGATYIVDGGQSVALRG